MKVGSTYFHLGSGSERKRYKRAAIDVLLDDKTARNPSSFFAYSEYNRPHKFYKSSEFVRLEKTFCLMRVTDISKCFASIYTHTIAWAVKDVQHGKETAGARSFANDFDNLMQFANYNETNGIPIGPELSRLFAEIILQSADIDLLRRAQKHGLIHGRDFFVRRYIDDYTIFANRLDVLDFIERALGDALGIFNLHLNEGKTHTVGRPFQTRKLQIISQTAKCISVFKERISARHPDTGAQVPVQVRDPSLVLTAFVEDIRTACKNAEAGYQDVSAYIIGAISNLVDSLIDSYSTSSDKLKVDAERYVTTFETLLSSLYFFFSVNVTVSSSQQVAKTTIVSLRFFERYLPDHVGSLCEIVRSLVADVIESSDSRDSSIEDYVPIEIMNIVLASSELPPEYRPNLSKISKRILSVSRVDYFSYVSLLFYYENSDPDFTKDIELQLTRKFLSCALPSVNSHDAHFMLDLVACPYLSPVFRTRVLAELKRNLGLPSDDASAEQALASEIQENPWFVNWKQIDLLNHLRKKELSVIY